MALPNYYPSEYLGYSGAGTFNQSGGTNSLGSSPGGFYLGYNAGSSGTYNLSGSGLLSLSGCYVYVGNSGIGTFTQSGGTESAFSLCLGYNAGSSGSYNLRGAGVVTNPYEYIGYSGSGTFTQSGGTNTIAYDLYLGYNLASSGSYNLSGVGAISVSNLFVGNSGAGTFTQSGGTNNAPSLCLGNNTGSSGSYNLSGAGVVTSVTECIGSSGSGTFTQSHGTNSSTGELYLGYNPASSGNYHLSGAGELVTLYEYVGYNGTGAFTQSGGTNSSTDTFYLGYYAGSSGSYNLSSGLLSALSFNSGTEYIGYSGSGAFTQTGGTNNLCSYLYIGYSSGSSGNYNLGSGLLAASFFFSGDEHVGYSGSGAFVQTGGTNNLGSSYLYVGDNSGSSGSYNLSGVGRLSAGGEFVGSSGTGTFTQTGGFNSVGLLNIGNLGRYQFRGGTLQITGPALVNQGSFDATQSTGLLTVTGSAIIDLSQATLVNTNSMSVSIGPNSLLLLPAGFNPAIALAKYHNLGLMDNIGSPLTVLPGQGFSGIGTIADHVNCQGAISATTNGSINLNGGVTISGTGNVSLGSGTLGVDDALSGINAGSLAAYTEFVGNTGSGAFTQSGGTNSLGSSSGGLYLGNNAGSSGVYYLSGPGVLSVSGTECVACSGTGTFHHEGGSNSVAFLTIGNLGRYQFGGGTLQVGSGLANQGVFDATGSAGLLTATGSAIIDFSTGTLQNTASMSLNIGPDSLLLLPAGFNPATALGSYSNLGLTHNVGTPLTILPGQGFVGAGSIADLVNCQGTISARNGSINLNGGVTISGTGNVSLGSGTLSADGSLLSITGGSLSAGYAYVGYSGTGAFTQSGGTNNIGTFENGGGLYLGYGASSSGSYNLSGAGVLAAPAEYVGCSGSGTFTQSGGTNGVGGGVVAFYLGYNAGTSGTYNLGGSGVISAPNDAYEYVGYSGTGIFTQSGGTNNIVTLGGLGGLYLGYSAGSSGSYNLSGAGVINSSQGVFVYNPNEGEYVGYSGTGAFTQSGGTNNIGTYFNGGGLYLGYNTGSSGVYNLSGSGVVVAFAEYVGCSGSGTFTQSGGTNGVGGDVEWLYIGYNNGSSGSYDLSGPGMLSAYYEYMGYNGTCAFTQSGGTNNTIGFSGSIGRGGLYLGYNSGSSGSYNLSGTGNLSSSCECVGFNGTGAFTQSSGTNNLGSNGCLYLGYGTSSSGVYNLSGPGLLAAYAGYMGYSGTGDFTQSGGTNSFGGGLYLGYNTGSSGSYNLSGAAVLAASSEYVGFNGTGTFTQSGGTNSIIGSGGNLGSGGLYLGYSASSSGVYNLSGGMLSASSEHVSTFTQSGGTNNITGNGGGLYVAYGGSGSYSLSGNGMLSASSEYVCYSGSESSTMGIFSQSGGTNNITGNAGALYVGYGGSGSYNLSGSGVLSASSEYVGDSGTGSKCMGIFNQSGGTNSIRLFGSGLYVGYGGSGSYNLSGSGVLSAYTECVGSPGSGLFTQTGGTNEVAIAFSLSWDGTYNLDGGLLVLSEISPSPYVASCVFNFNGGTLQASEGFSTSLPMTLGAGGGATFDTAGYTVTLFGSLSGPGSLTKVGSGTLILGGSNTFTGNTLISGGTLVLVGLQDSTLDTSGSGALSFGTFTKVTLGGLSGPGTFSLTNTTPLAVALSVGNNNADTTFSGMLQGGGSLNKIGSGALVLSGSNTYTGPTTISQGELLVDGWLTSSAFTVNGGTLGGTGSLSGGTVNAGGTLAPGDSLGVLHLSGNLVLASSAAALDYELGDNGYDQLALSGSAALNGTLNVNLVSGFTPSAGESFDLIRGRLTGSFSQIILPPLPNGLSWDTSSLYTTGTISVVPEPSTLALLGVAAIGLLGSVWRRRRKLRLRDNRVLRASLDGSRHRACVGAT